VQPAKLGEYSQQVKAGELVGPDYEFSFLQLPQFGKSFPCILANVQELFGVFLKNATGVSQEPVAGGPVE